MRAVIERVQCSARALGKKGWAESSTTLRVVNSHVPAERQHTGYQRFSNRCRGAARGVCVNTPSIGRPEEVPLVLSANGIRNHERHEAHENFLRPLGEKVAVGRMRGKARKFAHLTSRIKKARQKYLTGFLSK